MEQKISVNDLSLIISDLEKYPKPPLFSFFYTVLILSGFSFFSFFLSFFFGLYPASAGFLVPQAGIELVPSAVKAQSPNHWKASKFPDVDSE